ncbi:MAG: IS91 family transposase [Anaerolineales bacterium]|nr:IS91 family transposase [Anaerolineales bacterium]
MPVPNQYITYRSSTPLTVADVFREHWDEYRRKHRVSPQQAKVVGAMMSCRTPALGGRIDQCNECGALVFRYNSCRDRHCNQCQKYERAKWVEQQKVMQLPIPYFHIVFTTDHALNALFRDNKRAMYDLLFQTASEVLQAKARQELGCELGLTAVLHTWGQQMEDHIHLHCISTGGGLSLDGNKWVKPKSNHYLLNVVELSAAYRDRLLCGIERLVQRQEIVLADEAAEAALAGLLAELRAKKWEVFIKPFAGPEAVTEYLSRYVHQVAISNYRLESIEKGLVRFRYFDNRERAEVGGKGKEKILTVTGEEFIRRFLLHILPAGFVRIRYYGLHHSSARKEKLPRCRRLLGLPAALPVIPQLSLLAWLEQVLGEEAVDLCPYCGAKGSLYKRAEFERLPWLVALILSLISQPTRQGVCR